MSTLFLLDFGHDPSCQCLRRYRTRETSDFHPLDPISVSTPPCGERRHSCLCVLSRCGRCSDNQERGQVHILRNSYSVFGGSETKDPRRHRGPTIHPVSRSTSPLPRLRERSSDVPSGKPLSVSRLHTSDLPVFCLQFLYTRPSTRTTEVVSVVRHRLCARGSKYPGNRDCLPGTGRRPSTPYIVWVRVFLSPNRPRPVPSLGDSSSVNPILRRIGHSSTSVPESGHPPWVCRILSSADTEPPTFLGCT